MYKLYTNSKRKQTTSHEIPSCFLARKPRHLFKQSPVRSMHFAYSNRMGCSIAVESQLELDYFFWLEYEGFADYYEAQPHTFEYLMHGKKRRYTADFIVINDTSIQAIEVKYKKETDNPLFKLKTRVLTEELGKHGIKFVVVTDEQIRVGQRAQNIRMLMSKLTLPSPLDEFQHLESAIPNGHMTVTQLIDLLPELKIDTSFIAKAVAHKLIRADLTLSWPQVILNW